MNNNEVDVEVEDMAWNTARSNNSSSSTRLQKKEYSQREKLEPDLLDVGYQNEMKLNVSNLSRNSSERCALFFRGDSLRSGV